MREHEQSENFAGKIASETITQSICSGAGISAGLGKGIWQRVTDTDPRTGEDSAFRHILSGKPGSSWHRIYWTLKRLKS